MIYTLRSDYNILRFSVKIKKKKVLLQVKIPLAIIPFLIIQIKFIWLSWDR